MTASLPDNEAIFHAARDITEPDRRREYVRDACGGDEVRIAHIEALLAAADGTDTLLDRPAADISVATFDQPASEIPGRVIGPFKLIEPIGEGGMGSVWMAQQTEPIKRLVAVKLIKAGMDSRQVIARFEAERQALALMDHPNIARVLDAGATSVGRPYFVMDLVKGVPITRYCDEHQLTPRERLELFIPVCQAVQHAHQKGIIHRDLKPSNVLIALYDGKPVPKIIDFGVAKATGQQLTDKTLVTGFGAIVGTLEYMSPEQAEINQLDIDTRSDIYSLGVLLYELLAGSPPFSRQELEKAGMLEMLRVIREQEPTKPSTKLSTAEGLPTLAANRGTEPAKLARLVRGELDWIVMKALEKDRNRRYETANGFAMDVQRYLADEPVQACPPSAGYRLRKFLKRHKGPVAAAVLVLLTLLAGIIGTTWGLLRAEQQRHLAEAKQREAVAERDAKDLALKAEKQARADETKAGQQAFAALRSMTTDVVQRKFAQGAVLTDDDRAFLRGVIAQYDALAAIHGDDADSEAIRAEGRLRVGVMRQMLGEHKEAEQDFDQALGLYQQLAADLPSRTELREGVARSHFNRGGLLRVTGRMPKAEQDYDQALGLYQQLAADFPNQPEFRSELARSHNNRGFLLSATGRPMEAEKDHGQALGIQKRLVADFPSRLDFREELALSHNNRGNLLLSMGRLQDAEEDQRQALSIRQQLAADFPSSPRFRDDLAMSFINQGNLSRMKGRVEEAKNHYDQALSIRKQLAADFPSRPEYRQSLGRSHYNRASLLKLAGRPREAEPDYDQALSLFTQLAADFPARPQFRQELAQSLDSRGTLLATAGRLEEAGRDFDQALDLYKQLAGDFSNQPDLRNHLAGACMNRAQLHQQQGDWAAAKRLLLEGQPHHLAALKANPRHPTYREYYREHLGLLTKVNAGLLKREEAVRAAETCRDLGWDAPADAYAAARFLSQSIPIVTKHEKLGDQQRAEAAQFYGDAAMKLLRDAVSKGFKDEASVKKDADLDPLRQREDFRKLIAELQRKAN
jgi:eukaryotic-like serine/threonine-protein kinase